MPIRPRALDATPQKIVSALFGRWLSKRVHVYALRVHARHHVFDRTVLASRVHPLEHDKEGVAVLCIQTVLQFRQPHDVVAQLFDGVVLALEVARVSGIEVLERKALAGRDQ